MTDHTVDLDTIEATTRAALSAHGASGEVADIMAKVTRRAEETGNRVCGLSYLESYCLQLRSGRVSGRADHTVEHRTPASLVVDAKGGFAQVALHATADRAAEVARAQGLALYMITNSHTCTSLGYFTEHFATAHDLMAIGFTNASACVAPPGAGQPVIGTNPLAMTVPARGQAPRFHMDQATTAVALGTVKDAAARGEAVPEGWVVDAQGKATTDPGVIGQGGTMASSGGYKGWGLGLMVELLAAGLGGGTLSKDLAPLKAADGPPHGLSHSFLLIDTDAVSGGAFNAQLTALAGAIYAQDNARMPGYPRKLHDTVMVPEPLWQACQDLAGKGA